MTSKLAFLIALLFMLSSRAVAQVGQDAHPERVIIQTRSEAEAREIAKRYESELRTLMPAAQLYLLTPAAGDNPALILESLKREVDRGALIAFERDALLPHVFSDFTIPPNDPRYGGQWFLDRIDIEDAWRINAGDAATSIVVIDSGCDITHPDLESKLLPGYDAVDDDNDPSFEPNSESNEHGTACAGLAAAATNNEEGIAGACPNCSLRCIRLLPASGLVSESQDIAAFNFALESGAGVASNSWGLSSGVAAPQLLRTAIETFMRDARGGLGGVVIFAAGNDSREIRSNEVMAIPGVITVGAINNFDEAAQFSNHGASVLLTAPLGTLTTDIQGADGEADGDYTSAFGGTSSAAPIVAGIAGLLLSYDPTLTGAAVYDLLRDTARPAFFATPDEDGHDATYGYGIVDPAGALRSLAGISVDGGVDAGVTDASAAPSDDSSGCQISSSRRAPWGAAWCAAVVFALLFARRRATRFVHILSAFFLLACTPVEPQVAARAAELRPDSEDSTELPPLYDESDVVESLESPAGNFRVHFTRAGSHAVPSADTDTSGVPDYVELVAQTYDEVLTHYVSLGYHAPRDDNDVPGDNGGDSLFDVYLVDFGGGADGAYRRELCNATDGCSGYMLQENDFTGYHYPSRTMAVRLLAAHEFFHAIQATYATAESAQGSVLSEGTAVWASDTFDASLGDIQRFADAYLERTDRSLGVDPIGAVQSFSYGSGLFFRALSDSYDADLIRKLWQEMHVSHADGWVTALDRVLVAEYESSFEDAFVEFGRRNFYTGDLFDVAQSYSFGGELSRPAQTAVELPFEDETVRLVAAGMRYYVIDSPPSSPVRISMPLIAGDYETLHLLVAHVSSTQIVSLDSLSAQQTQTIELTGGEDQVVFALVDARVDGDTRRVRLCVSRESAADPCSATEADAGVGEADAGLVDAAMNDAAEESGGCGVSGARASGGSMAAVFALTLVLGAGFARRRQKRPV